MFKLFAFLNSDAPMCSKARRLIDILEDLLMRVWILSRQLAVLVHSFQHWGRYKCAKFYGTYTVELIVLLFHRVIDIHNFDIVLAHLSPFEAACVACRLGILNFYNPGKPEGSYELDMSRYEERVVAKVLVRLS